MRAATALVALLIGAVADVYFLHAVVFHRAGGWPNPSGSFFQVVAMGMVPFAWAALFLGALIVWRRDASWPLSLFIKIAVLGPLFSSIALAQYSHSSPGFILVGIVWQTAVLTRASYRLARGKSLVKVSPAAAPSA